MPSAIIHHRFVQESRCCRWFSKCNFSLSYIAFSTSSSFHFLASRFRRFKRKKTLLFICSLSLLYQLSRCVLASLYEGVSVSRSPFVCIRWLVRHTRVKSLKNGLNLNKIASGTRNYAKTSTRAVRRNASVIWTLPDLFFPLLILSIFLSFTFFAVSRSLTQSLISSSGQGTYLFAIQHNREN